jgi:hypothetical protein
MRFETMTDDELKRFLLLGTQDKCAALAMQEAVNRWLKVDERAEYNEGYAEGLAVGRDLGFKDAEKLYGVP